MPDFGAAAMPEERAIVEFVEAMEEFLDDEFDF
jgi:hypothetical protein